MQYLIYIGKHEETITHLSMMTRGAFYVTSSCVKAANVLEKIKDKYATVVFFEQTDIAKDIQDIKYLKKKYAGMYMVLITESLSREDSLEYLKAGINNTVSYDATPESIEGMITFLDRRNQQRIKDIREKGASLQTFKLPLWKRCFDIVFSGCAILGLSPLLLLTALAIRMESRGPIIYKSKRVGSNYKIFDFLKFRSMYTNADKRLKEFNSLNQYYEDEEVLLSNAGAVSDDNADEIVLISDDFVISENEYLNQRTIEQKNAFVKLENDPRITKVGRFIRKYSIDELPQLINILKGDMSIVGNRPLPLYEAELLTSDDYIDRFMAPAGLTGLWQVEKRGDSGRMSADERKLLDIKYAKTFSFWLDVKIIFRTLTAFIQKENV